MIRYAQVMPTKFKPLRFFVMRALAAFVVCGLVEFYTHPAAHGDTAEERAAYELGNKAADEAPRDAKFPSAAELNMIAQEYFEQHGSGDQVKNPSAPGGLQARKQAFENGYTEGFTKTHHSQ